MTLSKETLDEGERLEKAATDTPWKLSYNENGTPREFVQFACDAQGYRTVCIGGTNFTSTDDGESNTLCGARTNMEFVLFLCNNARELLAAARREAGLRESLEKCEFADVSDGGVGHCPVCYSRSSHGPNCWLIAALSATGEVE